jgi:hypothetical protein
MPGVRKTASNLRTVSSEKTGEVKREVEGTRETYYYDPAVVGQAQAQAFVDADGNIIKSIYRTSRTKTFGGITIIVLWQYKVYRKL